MESNFSNYSMHVCLSVQFLPIKIENMKITFVNNVDTYRFGKMAMPFACNDGATFMSINC